jgi:putative heme-binding domain-containing protein
MSLTIRKKKLRVALLTFEVGVIVLGGLLDLAQTRPLPTGEVVADPAPSSDGEQEQVRDDEEQARYRAYALAHRGDVERGRRLFTGNRLSCVSCHGMPGDGGDIGPDLFDVGRKHDRAYVITAVLRPSVDLAPGYGTVSLTLKDGTAIEGKLEMEGHDGVVLADAQGRIYKVSHKEIKKRRNDSPMPNGWEKHISLDEFADLIAFLESLRGQVTRPRK